MMARETKPIQQRITVARPAPAVYRALTDSDEVASWFAEDAYIELIEGGRYEVLGRHGWKRGRLSTLEEDRHLVISWPVELDDDQEAQTTIDVSLEARGDKTVVTINHTFSESEGPWESVYEETQTGWPEALKTLEKFMSGQYKGKPRSWLP